MKENGFEYVDLGLPSGTMWATFNVGATKPEDEGLLFQFGRVDGYKYKDRNNKFTKDDLSTTSGKTYNKGETLDLDDDAAHVNMGGAWRMPTNDEFKELLDNTTHNLVTINGVLGMRFTSNTNGYQLFIPFMQGYWYDGTWFSSAGIYASMWSSQVGPSNSIYAYLLYCNYSSLACTGGNCCSCAFSVRGVFRK